MAFLMGYYQFGNSFFEPRVYDLLGEGGKAASEFPLMYFVGAQLAKIFGPSMAIMRSLSLLLTTAGMWSFFQILFRENRRFGLAFFGTIVTFSGTVFYYYSINAIQDISALATCLVGWYGFYRFYTDFKKPYLYLATFAFALSALFKITYLIHPIAGFLAVFLFFPNNDIRGNWNRKQWLRAMVAMLGFCALLAAAWVGYVKHYNSLHGNWYFLSKATPIWNMTWEQITAQMAFLKVYWGESYFFPSIWRFWLFILCFNIYGSYKFRSMWNTMHWIVLAGTLAYFLLFFRQFADHDYYFLLCYPYFAFLMMAFLVNLRELFPRQHRGLILLFILVFYSIGGIKHSKSMLNGRFKHNDMFAAPCLPLEGYHTILDSLHIPNDARFVILGDLSVNGAAYFIRRQAYTVHDTSQGQFIIMQNLMPKHRYEYALSIDSLSFGPYIESWDMKLLHTKPGIALYRIDGRDLKPQ